MKEDEHPQSRVGSKRKAPVSDVPVKESETPRKRSRIEDLHQAHLDMVVKADGFFKAYQHYHVTKAGIDYLNTPKEIKDLLKFVKGIE